MEGRQDGEQQGESLRDLGDLGASGMVALALPWWGGKCEMVAWGLAIESQVQPVLQGLGPELTMSLSLG